MADVAASPASGDESQPLSIPHRTARYISQASRYNHVHHLLLALNWQMRKLVRERV